MNNSTLKSLLIEYDKKRINAENIAQKEKENLYTEFAELAEIDKKLSSLAFSSMRELAKNNDKLALKIVEKFSNILGRALANISIICNPEVFVIGGGVSKAGDILLEGIKKSYRENALSGDFF